MSGKTKLVYRKADGFKSVYITVGRISHSPHDVRLVLGIDDLNDLAKRMEACTSTAAKQQELQKGIVVNELLEIVMTREFLRELSMLLQDQVAKLDKKSGLDFEPMD